MDLLDLNGFVTILLAIALTGERLVTALKNAYPEFFAFEPKNEAGEVNLPADRGRRVVVQLLGFFFCWIATGYVATGDIGGMLGDLPIGSGTPARTIPAWIVGLLASSGSALWSSVLGYTSAIKDIRRQDVAKSGLDYREQAKDAGVKPPVDSGMAGREQDDPRAHPAPNATTQPQFEGAPSVRVRQFTHDRQPPFDAER